MTNDKKVSSYIDQVHDLITNGDPFSPEYHEEVHKLMEEKKQLTAELEEGRKEDERHVKRTIDHYHKADGDGHGSTETGTGSKASTGDTNGCAYRKDHRHT